MLYRLCSSHTSVLVKTSFNIILQSARQVLSSLWAVSVVMCAFFFSVRATCAVSFIYLAALYDLVCGICTCLQLAVTRNADVLFLSNGISELTGLQYRVCSVVSQHGPRGVWFVVHGTLDLLM